MHTSLTALSHALVRAASGSSGGSSGGSGSSGAISLLILVAIFGLAYFVFLRPARNRQRAAASARRQVEVGDEVTTTSGLIATVVAVEDDVLTLEIAPGVHCRYLPAAILRVNSEDEPAEDAAPDVPEQPTDGTGEPADGTTPPA